MNKYGKKQRKHTRSIYLNTDDAIYVDSDRKTFKFSIAPINIEDESKLYVENTIVDYKQGGLGVKNVSSAVIGSTSAFTSTYNAPPAITFASADGKGTGALGVGIIAPSGLSGSASSTTTSVNATSVGQGYTGTASLYVGVAIPPASGGTGATITSGNIDSINGGLSAVATLTAGSGYYEVPTIPIPPAPASVPAILSIAYTPSTGVLSGITVSNPTLNGFYNTNLFTIGVVNNPVQLTGVLSTNASGTITDITITNPSNNGFYSETGNAVSILTINGVAPTGSGMNIGFNYNQGRCDNASIYSGGSGYGANLVNAVIGFPVPATPTNAIISSKTITAGRLTALTLSSGGTKYYNPSVNISLGLMTPINASYEPVFKIASGLVGVKMISFGRGYTSPPLPVISTSSRVVSGGDLPLVAETAPTSLIEPNNYYTIKADGFQFNRSLYANTDNKGLPTIAICSSSEFSNNEEYSELIIPAQVINDITLTIHDTNGLGLDVNRNLRLLMKIEEIEIEETEFLHSKRQDY
jgi:hypothetical protein